MLTLRTRLTWPTLTRGVSFFPSVIAHHFSGMAIDSIAKPAVPVIRKTPEAGS